jgi:hypothetical protein
MSNSSLPLQREKDSRPVSKSSNEIETPTEADTIRKHAYLLIPVHDCSGLIKSIALVQKSQASSFWKGFCEHAFNALNKRVTYLKCDNAREFRGARQNFKEDMGKQGKLLNEIRDYISELNESAERNVRTIPNVIRGIVKIAKLPQTIYGQKQSQ